MSSSLLKATTFFYFLFISSLFTQVIAQPGGMPGPVEDYATYLDLRYADRDETRNLLDIYVPNQIDNPPIVVYIHGGGFMFGDKSDPRDLQIFLKAGIAVASINYRLSGTTQWPGQLEDLEDAFAFIREQSDQYGYDSTRIASLGGSAGAHLAAMAGIVLSHSDQTRLKATVALFPPILFDKMDEDIAAVEMTPLLGPTDSASSPESRLIGAAVGENPELVAAASPLSYLEQLPTSAPLPAFMIMHGANDRNIARGQSGRLFTALLNRPTISSLEYHLFPRAGHGGGEFDELQTTLMIIDFLKQHL